jgi:hypothetical protein
VVAVSHHVATDVLCQSLSARGIRFVVLDDGVTGGFGAETALVTISEFLDADHPLTTSIAEFSTSKGAQS